MTGRCVKCGGEAAYRVRSLPEGIRDYCQAHWDERQQQRDDHLEMIARKLARA